MSAFDAIVLMLGSFATLVFLMELHNLLRRSSQASPSTLFAYRVEDGQPLEIWLEEDEPADPAPCRHCGGGRK